MLGMCSTQNEATKYCIHFLVYKGQFPAYYKLPMKMNQLTYFYLITDARELPYEPKIEVRVCSVKINLTKV